MAALKISFLSWSYNFQDLWCLCLKSVFCRHVAVSIVQINITIYSDVYLTYFCSLTQFCKVLPELTISVGFDYGIVHDLGDSTAHSLLQVTDERVE